MDRLSRLAVDARQGDRAAEARFLTAVAKDVWRLCHHFGDAGTVEDLVQETLTRVLAGLHRYRGEAQARTWVLAIAWRVCADQVRHERRQAAATARLGQQRAPEQGADEAEVELFDLLDRLEPDRRAAFVLTQLLTLPYQEAAVALRCPVGTVRSRVARARLDLLRSLPPRPERSSLTGPLEISEQCGN